MLYINLHEKIIQEVRNYVPYFTKEENKFLLGN